MMRYTDFILILEFVKKRKTAFEEHLKNSGIDPQEAVFIIEDFENFTRRRRAA